MSGLLAANIFRKMNPVVMEKQSVLPDNHGALLRFRTRSVSDSSGIPFKDVFVRKQINYHGKHFTDPTIPMANEYCLKVSGEYNDRSVWNLSDAKRFIAPDNFLKKLEDGCNIKYNSDFNNIEGRGTCPIISTMPMYNLMKILGWREIPEFKHREIFSITFNIEKPNIELYQTTYYPNIKLPFYRISITENKIIMEFLEKPLAGYEWESKILSLFDYCNHFLKHDFGISISEENISNFKTKHQKYGKLIPIDVALRKKFIAWATNKHGIYSLGRWATHRQILMDDVVEDIKVIEKLIETNNYGR